MSNRGFRGGEDNPYGQNYATGGGAGGGFLAGGSQTDSPSTKQAGNNFLRPVTIRQILNAEQPHPDADFMLDGSEILQVTFVGVVRNISRNATNVAYSVEDGTGQIEVRQWLDSSSDDTQKTAEIRQNVYVRILGQLKSFQNRRSISAGHIRPVENFNEVMFHRLDAVQHHLQHTKGLKPTQTNGHSNAPAGDASAYSNNVNQNNTDSFAGLPPMSRKIMQLVTAEADNSSDGVHVAHIARVLKGDATQIREVIEELTTEGYLYTAVDDDHVLPTS